VDLASAEGDAVDPLFTRFGLSVIESAALVLEVWGGRKKRPKAVSIVQKLLDSDSAGSLPYAEELEFEADRRSPVLRGVGTVKLGRYRIPRLGLGCMRLLSQGGTVGGKPASALGIPRSPEASRHALLNAVRHGGVRYLDVARGYGPWPGAAEGLLRDWFAPFPADLAVASKVGYGRVPDGGWKVDLDPAFLRRELVASHRQFGQRVPVMYLVVRSTPATPVVNRPKRLAAAMKPMLEAKKQGLIDAIGVANVTLEDLKELEDAGPIDVVQCRFSLDALKDDARVAVLEHCHAQKRPFIMWGLFGEGTGAPTPPRALVSAAKELGVTPGELSLRLLLSLSPQVVLLPGAARRETIDSSIRGASLKLSSSRARELLEACR
jgi:pyridoxine 4-dehydrogenase